MAENKSVKDFDKAFKRLVSRLEKSLRTYATDPYASYDLVSVKAVKSIDTFFVKWYSISSRYWSEEDFNYFLRVRDGFGSKYRERRDLAEKERIEMMDGLVEEARKSELTARKKRDLDAWWLR
jgi:hypothetical protein